MPKLGGRQFYDALRQSGSDVRILFTSGYSAREVQESIALTTGLPFLQKPWTLAQLLTRVRAILDRDLSG